MFDLPPYLCSSVNTVVCSSLARYAILLCFCTLKAFAAWVYRSAAFSYFSVRPPNMLKPPDAPWRALSAYKNLVNTSFSESSRLDVPSVAEPGDLVP